MSYFKPTYIKISFNNLHREFNRLDEYTRIYSDYNMELMKLSIKKDKIKEKTLKKRLSSKAQYKIYLRSLEIIKDNSEKDSIITFSQQDIEEILEFEYINDESFYWYTDDEIDTFLNKFIHQEIDRLSSKKYLLEDFKKEFFTQKDEDNVINIFFYLYKIGFLEYDFYDDKGNRFSNLSSGEKSLFIDFNLIRKSINQSIKDNKEFKDNGFDYKENIELLIFLDEPDLTLHPDWQKQYIASILSILKQYKDITFHLIVTTHSPFLLSDIPKQNIIFLDKEENGNCKVLNHDEVLAKKQTFGANIHTLLSDSFFMEDGLMGEFARGKISEIIDFHKIVQKKRHTNCLKKIYLAKRKDRFWQTQSIIGEEYLKQVVKNHLVEIEKTLLGKDGAKKEEIIRVEAYLESLKK